jgi:hypothetical protein
MIPFPCPNLCADSSTLRTSSQAAAHSGASAAERLSLEGVRKRLVAEVARLRGRFPESVPNSGEFGYGYL